MNLPKDMIRVIYGILVEDDKISFAGSCRKHRICVDDLLARHFVTHLQIQQIEGYASVYLLRTYNVIINEMTFYSFKKEKIFSVIGDTYEFADFTFVYRKLHSYSQDPFIDNKYPSKYGTNYLLTDQKFLLSIDKLMQNIL